MIFPMPHYPCHFEIPDDWLAEAGVIGFTPTTAAFASTPNAMVVPLTQIEPPVRFHSTPKDHAGFDRSRLVHHLRRFVAGEIVDPVPMLELPVYEYCAAPFRFRVCDGVHRFYGSIAARFSHLPGKP